MFSWESRTCVTAALFSQYLRAADFGDHLPGFIEDRQPLGLWRVGTSQAATQRPEQQVLERRCQSSFFFKHLHPFGSPHHSCSCPLTFGKPASSQSLIIPMKSVALAATNSGLKALMTEFSSKALWETGTWWIIDIPCFSHPSDTTGTLRKGSVKVRFWTFCFICRLCFMLQKLFLFDSRPPKNKATLQIVWVSWRYLMWNSEKKH